MIPQGTAINARFDFTGVTQPIYIIQLLSNEDKMITRESDTDEEIQIPRDRRVKQRLPAKTTTSGRKKANLAYQFYDEVDRVKTMRKDEKEAYIVARQRTRVNEPIVILELKECLADMKP